MEQELELEEMEVTPQGLEQEQEQVLDLLIQGTVKQLEVVQELVREKVNQKVEAQAKVQEAVLELVQLKQVEADD